MTKRVVKFAFWAYQRVFSGRVATCRYRPTCSRYALDAVEKYGVAKGSFLSAKRILSCHPFSKRPYLDPA